MSYLNKEYSIVLTDTELSYIAGFIDGDGSIFAQIVRGSSYTYKHRVRVSITFFQKSTKHDFLLRFKESFKFGSIRFRKDGISEYTITSNEEVRLVLQLLLPFLRLKKDLAVAVLDIIEASKSVKTEKDFLDLCGLVDKTASMTYSKTRSITQRTVALSLLKN